MKKNQKNSNNGWYNPARKKMKKGTKIFLVLASIALVIAIAAAFAPQIIVALMQSPFSPFENDPETLALIAPVDDKADEKIASIPAYSKDDTWAVYVYLVGSNLESDGIDELSALTNYLIADDMKTYEAEEENKELGYINAFVDEVTSQGVDLPQILYRPDTSFYKQSMQLSDHGSEQADMSKLPDEKGYASSDFSDMMSAEYSDNLQIVVQTGGARRWQNSLINPNRSQRFLMSAGGVEMIYDEPVVNMADPDTLTDFIDFCTENYPADHTMLLLWNHGGGFSGFGNDEIFGMDCLSLAEIRSAIENVVGCNPDDPYFEAIGFDACLMASLEAAHELSGLGRYLLASEESEPATGWDYLTWIPALCSDPGMNGAQLGKIVADSYVELSLGNYADLGYIMPSTFSVTDISKADAVYAAYCDFASAALKKISSDRSFLAELSRAARNSIAYAGNYYKVFNTIDLGIFMEELRTELPEAEKVIAELHDAVLYSRSSSYLKESMGLSVYFPARIEGMGGINSFLKYINDVSQNNDVNALYYYKIAGCLNEALSEYVLSEGIESLKPVDYSVLSNLSSLDVECLGDGNLSINLSGPDLSLLQSTRMGVARCDAETGDIEYYGEDVFAFINEDGTVGTNFTGSWLHFGGNPLPLEVMSVTGENAMFSTKIIYNGFDAKLITGYNAETDEVSILGVRLADDASGILDRALLPMRNGDLIIIEYESGNLDSNIISQNEKLFIYREGITKLEEKPLEDGNYLQYIIFEDLRCDTYYSGIVSFCMKNAKISDQQLELSLFGFDKN